MNIQQYKTPYNIYYGTISNDSRMKVQYRYTKNYKTEQEALEDAKNAATSMYYQNEGKHGIMSFTKVSDESDITGVDLAILYEEHINDMCRWYAIPTEVDSISTKDLKW